MRATRGTLARSLVAAALAAFASLLVVTPALGAPTWLAPAKLSASGQSAQAPQVSVDPQGDALVVYQRFDEKSGTTVIEASSRPAGSVSWQAPVVISNTEDEASLPQVALDSSGDAEAVWLSYNGSEYSIQAASRPGLAGSWQAPVSVRALGTMTVMEPRPDLAVDPHGEAVALWQRVEAGKDFVEAATRPAGGAWQAPETLSSETEALHPAEVGIDAAGNVTAVWEQKGAEVLIDAASKVASGKWQAPTAISAPGANANEPRLAVDSAGDAVAIWERFEGEELIEAATKPASSGTWRTPVALTQPEGGKGEPAGQQVALDAQGDAVVVWSRTNAAAHDVVEATEASASSSAWKAPVALSAPGATVEEQPRAAVNANGDAVVVWERFNGTNEVVEAASGLATSGAWQAPVALSAPGQTAAEQQVSLDAQGNAAAVWDRFDGKASYIAEAAGYDAAGPVLGSPAIPATGTVGQSLAFSVSPLDVWSALGATSWSFGDGTSQAGTSVTHAFDAPGTYTVAVTGTDVLGNTTSTGASVSIAATSSPAKTPGSTAVAPKITSASLSRSRFRVGARATAISARAKGPQGTSFHFTLSEAAQLRIVFTHTVAGLRSGKRCVAPSGKLRAKHAKHCTRRLGAGALTRAGEHAGADSIAFSGRIGTKPLASGLYHATLTASAGGLSSAAVSLSFTIVR